MEESGTASLTPQESVATTVCWACGGMISAEDFYCRFCGKGQGKKIHWYYKQWGIILLTVLALGPFSIIFVWKSPLLSRRAKWINTAAIALLTAYVVYKMYGLWLALTDPSAGML